jgi:hypothetical protein
VPVEEDPKKKGKGEAPAEPEIRTVTPDPEILEEESGREFEIELGRHEQVPIEKEKPPTPEDAPEEGAEEGEEPEVETEEKWITYKFDQKQGNAIIRAATEKGVLCLDGLQYELSDSF